MTREEAVTALGDRNNLLWGMSKEEKKYYSEALDMAISALSETKGEDRPKGHWMHDGSHWENRFICSGCNYKLFDEPTNFCPNCGADMRKGGE